MTITYSYVEIIGKQYPAVFVSCNTDPYVYANIVHEGGDALPPQVDLDAAILEAMKVDMWNLIKDERDRRRSQCGTLVGGNWYHSDDTSRIQQIALVMLGASMPTGIMWKTMAGTYVEMTPALALGIYQGAITTDSVLFTIAEQKRLAMIASSDPANYNYLSGWPEGYGE